VRFQDIAGVVETFLTKDTAAWRAEGKLGVQTPVGVLQIPLQTQGTFEVPKVPQVALGNPRVSNLSFQGATIDFPLSITNRNSYPLPVGGLEGQLAIAGVNVGTIGTGDLGKLDPKGTRQVSLPVNVNLFNAGQAVQRAVAGGNQQVQLNAHLVAGGQRIPVRLDQVVNFLR
jgi:LEA14-like dessication related protein